MKRSWSRTVLALRAAGVLLIGVGAVQPLKAVARWGADRSVWRAARGEAEPVFGELSVVGYAVRRSDPWPWMLRHGPPLLALAGGVYLLGRRGDRLLARTGAKE